MTKGQQLTIAGEPYSIELIGPVTTLLLRLDGAFFHVCTRSLRHALT